MQTSTGLRGVEFKRASAKPPIRRYFEVKSEKNVIGVVDPCYGSSHVIYGLDTQTYVHQTVRIAPSKRLDRNSTFFQFTPLILDASISLVHTWNSIPVNKDFVVSFELELPRYLFSPKPSQVRFAFKLLQGSRCKKILALSDFAYRTAARRMREFGFPDLVSKMDVFRGAIRDPLSLRELPPRPPVKAFGPEEPLTAVLIGTELFRKGGMYAIKAFEKLREAGLNVTLTLIGGFEKASYTFNDWIPDAAEWTARARSHDWIRLVGPIPNSEVFVELRKHHICLYPSLDESLGWLPIESQMIEVPICGNRVCAFPELVDHDKTGWLTEMPLAENDRWIGIDAPSDVLKEALVHADTLVTQGIVECITKLYGQPELIEQWGKAGRKKALDMYGMEAASKQLDQIYDAALSV